MDVERRTGGGAADRRRQIRAVAERDFTHDFGRYKIEAQDHDVPVSSDGRIVGYFVDVREYERLQALKAMRRRVILTADLSDDGAEEIFGGRMDPRHDHLKQASRSEVLPGRWPAQLRPARVGPPLFFGPS
jgi:hypothetical protein